MRPRAWVLADDPIDDRPTFLAHALALGALHGPGPWPGDGYPLPDEPPRPAGDGPLISSVVLDGIRTHHFGTQPSATSAAEIAGLLVHLTTESPDRAALTALHERLADRSPVDVADDLVTELRDPPHPERLRELALHLLRYGTRRNTVKLGIVVLGVVGDERDRESLLLLGSLEEFTLYAVVALVKTQPDGRRAAYELARRVEGWGRIHAVERLARCDDPEIKAWLLREGFRNGVMNEYLAHLAATTGDLYAALLEPEVDDALLDGAGGILAALATGGPAKDMRDYPEAVPAMHRFAELAAAARPTIDRLSDLLTIAGFVRRPDEDFPWPTGEPGRLAARYTALLDRPIWRDVVLAALAHPVGPYGFGTALSCAGRLGGVDALSYALPYALSHLADRDPFDAYVWQWVVGRADATTVTTVVEHAERLLPLDRLGDGPANDSGFGPDRAADHALEAIVGGLGAHPGVGLVLLCTALTSPVTRIRRSVLRALAAWPPEAVPEEIAGRIAEAARREPDAELRAELLAFPAG